MLDNVPVARYLQHWSMPLQRGYPQGAPLQKELSNAIKYHILSTLIRNIRQKKRIAFHRYVITKIKIRLHMPEMPFRMRDI